MPKYLHIGGMQKLQARLNNYTTIGIRTLSEFTQYQE